MAGRIRSIKPEIIEDERPASLSDSAWRLWVSMWLVADDHGNCRASVEYLRGKIWWAHTTSPDVEALLRELAKAGSIVRYIVRGQQYAHVERWEKHQRIDNAGTPRVPLLIEADSCDSPRSSEKFGSDQDQEEEKDIGVGAKEAAATPPSSSSGQQPFSLDSPPSPASRAKGQDIKLLITHYCTLWVETYKPTDGKPPRLDRADKGQAGTLVREYGIDQAKEYVTRYLRDAVPWLTERRHPLSLILRKVNEYRTKAPVIAPARHGERRGVLDPIPAQDESKDGEV